MIGVAKRNSIVLSCCALLGIGLGLFRLASRGAGGLAPGPAAASSDHANPSGDDGKRAGAIGVQVQAPERVAIPAGRQASTGGVDDRIASPVEDEIWVLVDQLRAMAKEPSDFHQRAYPVMKRLTAQGHRLAQEPAGVDGTMAGTNGPERVEQVVAELVDTEAETDLFRGAVFVALAECLSTGAFRARFAGWLEVMPESLELVRAAAIAASCRGEDVQCSAPVTINEFAALPAHPGLVWPATYPLELRRVVAPYEASLLAEWLERPDERKERFKLDQESAASTQDPQAMVDYLAAVETVYAIWGYRALVDPLIEDQVLARASLDGGQWPADSMVYFRASSLIVYSLAACNDRMFDLVVRLASSEHALLAGMAQSMSRLVAGGLGMGLISKIEAKRYTNDTVEVVELALLIDDIGQRMPALIASGSEALGDACRYLDGIVQDAGVADYIRATALSTISKSESWEHLSQSTAQALAGNSPEMTAGIAAASLVQYARAHPEVKAKALQIFVQAQNQATQDWLRDDIQTFIAELQ